MKPRAEHAVTRSTSEHKPHSSMQLRPVNVLPLLTNYNNSRETWVLWPRRWGVSKHRAVHYHRMLWKQQLVQSSRSQRFSDSLTMDCSNGKTCLMPMGDWTWQRSVVYVQCYSSSKCVKKTKCRVRMQCSIALKRNRAKSHSARENHCGFLTRSPAS